MGKWKQILNVTGFLVSRDMVMMVRTFNIRKVFTQKNFPNNLN